MSLVNEFERSGNWLFRHRGWLPVFLILAGIVVLYLTNRQAILFNMTDELIFLGISIAGEAVRVFTTAYAPRNTSGRNTLAGQIADELNTKGIYSLVRHPLYIGNFLMWLGPVLFVRSFLFLVIFILVYWLYYERIMFAEEQFLGRKFGKAFDDWSEKVKAVIPRFRGYEKPSLAFSVRSVLKREHNSFINIFVIFLLLDVFRNYFLSERIYITKMWIYIGISAGVLWLLITIIHKTTGWLDEEDR